jgi:hypothetical protein
MEGWSARGGEGAPTSAEVRALQAAVDRDSATGYWRWTLDRLDAKEAAGQRVSSTDRAAALAATGDPEGAFMALEQALTRHDPGLQSLDRDPVWDRLRADPRFADIVRRSRSMRSVPDAPRPPGRD